MNDQLPPALAPAATDALPTRRWKVDRRMQVLLCASGASFMIMLDSNIVAVSLPSIARDLHAAFADIEWVISAYILSFAALLMAAGALADRFGRKPMLVVGLTVFSAASALCGLAPSAAVLNIARALQGVGAAMQLSAGLSVLSHAFRGPDRARAFGFWGSVVGVAVAVGPLVGGTITSAFGWRWAFLVNIPVGVALVMLTIRSIDDSRDPAAGRLDLAGMALFGGALTLLVWALIEASGDGWSSQPTYLKLAGAGTLLALYVVAEFAQERPMVDFALFRRRTFLGSSVAMLGFASAAQVMMTYLPLYLQNSFGFSPVAAGIGMLPFALPLVVMPRIAAWLAGRISGRALLTLGLVVVAAGNFATAAVVAADLSYAVVAFGMVMTGCGAGLLNGETAKVGMGVVPVDRAGMASGIGGTLRFVGLVTGLTGLGTVLARETERYLVQANPGMTVLGNGAHGIASRIIAGDVAGVIAEVAQPAQAALREVASRSFAAGFTEVLVAAGMLAVLGAVLTYSLVSALETAPPTRLNPIRPS